MGIVNVTPDSFSDGGAAATAAAAIARGRRAGGAGADILDIGGESTRPGAAPVPRTRSCARVLPVLRGLAGAAPVSDRYAESREHGARRWQTRGQDRQRRLGA